MYTVESIERGIEATYKNEKIFEEAAEKERQTRNEYREMIEQINKQNAARGGDGDRDNSSPG